MSGSGPATRSPRVTRPTRRTPAASPVIPGSRRPTRSGRPPNRARTSRAGSSRAAPTSAPPTTACATGRRPGRPRPSTAPPAIWASGASSARQNQVHNRRRRVAGRGLRGRLPGYLRDRLRQRPMLVGAAVAGPQLQLGSQGGGTVGMVGGFAGGRVDQFPVARLPLLVGAAVAGPPLDLGAVTVVGAGDVHAAAIDRQCAVAVNRPALRGRDAVAAVGVPWAAVGGVGDGQVDPVGAFAPGDDRPGRPAAAAG